MRKIVINTNIGGFSSDKYFIDGLTHLFRKEDIEFYENDLDAPIGSEKFYEYAWQLVRNINRTNPEFIDFVEKGLAENKISGVKVIEIPEDVLWNIGENEMGCEYIYEVHKTWS